MGHYTVSQVVQGLRHHQFRLALEPQVNLQTGKIVGMECLARWHHPEDGVVAPAKFLPQLESSGLVTPLAYEILDRSFAVKKQLRRAGYTGSFSINVSNKTLLDWTFARDVSRIAQTHDESLVGITFEVTESSSITDDNLCSESLQELSRLGVKLSLDDFWTGYSSLNKPDLDRFREVKVDYQLTSKIHQDRVALAGLASIVTFANNLNWQCVVEGVENVETIHRLLELGCEIGQGYYFARPISEYDVVQWFQTNTVDQKLDTAAWNSSLSHPVKPLPLLDQALIAEYRDSKMPIWAFNLDRMKMEWGNTAAVDFWMADSLEELIGRDFTSDMSAAAREKLLSFRDRLGSGGQFAEQWTVFPKGAPKPVYCTFSCVKSISGDLLLLIKGFEGFLSIQKTVDTSQFAESANIPAIAMTIGGHIYWRNVAASRQFGIDSQFLTETATRLTDGSSMIDRVLAHGELTQDLAITTDHCTVWYRANARLIRDPKNASWSILVYLTSICDLVGCSRLDREAPDRPFKSPRSIPISLTHY